VSSDPMTALDFVISVLRQHESELNELSLRLEEMIKEITGKDVKNDLGKIQSNLKNIQKNLQELNKKASSSESSDKNLKKIIEKIDSQTQRFDVLTESVKSISSMDEFSSLTSNLRTLLSEKASILSTDSPILQLVDWSDMKSQTSNPELVIYNIAETSISVIVEKDRKRYVYTEFIPPETFVDEDLSQVLYGKMKSGIELIKKIERFEKGRVKIKFIIPEDFDVKSWLSWELKAPVNKIIEGKNIS
jgi:archaellum component FlaC